MGRWKIGSFTAAIGCIAVGAVVALAQYDVITYAALGFLWPALLILFGVEMLIRLFIRSDAKSRVSGWAIVLIILLVGASAGQSVLAGGTLNGLFGKNKLAPLSGTMEVGPDIKAVKIVLPNGKVKINGEATEGPLKYEGSLLVPADSDSEAESTLAEKWKTTTEGDTLVLKLDIETSWLSGIQFGFSSKNPYLNVDVPHNLAVEVTTSDGSVEAFGLQSGLTVDTSNGTLNLHDIVGGVKAQSSNGSLTVQNIQGGVKLISSNGAMTLEKIDGSLSAKSSNGKIIVDSAVTGDWELSSSNGKIDLGMPAATDAKITADTSNGSLKGNVPWERDGDNHGTASLGNGTHTVNASTSNGSVTVNIAE